MGAPYPPVPNTVKVRISGTNGPEIWANILHYQYTGTAPPTATLNTYALNVANSWGTTMKPACPAPIVLTQVTVTDLASNTGAEGLWAGNNPGSRGDDVIGGNTAFLISYPTTLRYRGGHFRQYLLCGGNADLADSAHWSAAFTTEVRNDWVNFLDAISSNGIGPTTITNHVGVRYHGRYLPNGGPPHYILTTPLVVQLPPVNSLGHALMASQKGRIGRRSK